MATAVGGNHGQMIGIGTAAAVPFNWMSDMPEEAMDEFIAMNGADPRANPRVRAVMSAPEMTVLAESDFATPEALRTPFYADLFVRYDTPFVAMTRLTTSYDVTAVLAITRSAGAGHIDEWDRRAFAAIAPYARTAVTTRMALEHRGADLVAGALEAVSAAAFILDSAGRVAAMTPAAEALVSGPKAPLRLVAGRLQGRTPQAEGGLGRFLAEALADDGRPTAIVAIRSPGAPLVLEAVPAPPVEYGLGFSPRVIVIARSGDAPAEGGAALKVAFGLTGAEFAVASALQRGLSPDEIATERSVSIETVRSQIRGLMTKTETRRQSELVALLGRYV